MHAVLAFSGTLHARYRYLYPGALVLHGGICRLGTQLVTEPDPKGAKLSPILQSLRDPQGLKERQRRGNLQTSDIKLKDCFAAARVFASLMGWAPLAMTALLQQ